MICQISPSLIFGLMNSGLRQPNFGNSGTEEDIYGEPLERDDQVVCLKVQDLVISYDGGEYMLRTAKYVDDLLVKVL